MFEKMHFCTNITVKLVLDLPLIDILQTNLHHRELGKQLLDNSVLSFTLTLLKRCQSPVYNNSWCEIVEQAPITRLQKRSFNENIIEKSLIDGKIYKLLKSWKSTTCVRMARARLQESTCARVSGTTFLVAD